MDKNTIEIIISKILKDDMDGVEQENPKLDFKSKWHNLTEEISICEFLKDVTAIGNTVGLDGYLILGYDSKTRQFNPAKFKDSNLRDENELNNLISSRVSGFFHVNVFNLIYNQNALSVIHIPPVFEKPLVIKNYTSPSSNKSEQRIFVRKGTSARVANKYDIDFMFYDRKNVTPEIQFKPWLISIQNHGSQQITKEINISMVIENSGLKTIALREIEISIHFKDAIVKLTSRANKAANSPVQTISKNPLLIKSGDTETFPYLIFQSNPSIQESKLATIKEANLGLTIEVDIVGYGKFTKELTWAT